MASKRGNPVEIAGSFKPDKHEEMCNEMNDAIYSLRDQISKPFARSGEKLLPSKLRTSEKPGAKQARRHIARLHKAFKAEK